MNQTNRRYIVTLAAVAAGILVVGVLLRPGQPTLDDPLPGPSPAELSRLSSLSQRRSVDGMAEYFATVAGRLEAHVVSLPSLDRSGIVWEPGLVVTSRTELRFPDAATVTTPTGDVGVAAVAAAPDLPIAALRISPVDGLSPPRREVTRPLGRGEWTIALWWRDRQASFAPAHFFGTAPVRCGGRTVDEVLTNVAWAREMTGGGLFDLDGSLIAVITPCGERFAAVVADGVADLLRDAQSIEGQLLRRYGLRLGSLSVPEQEYFARHAGLLVREVWTGYAADEAGVEPGDVLVAVNAFPVSDVDRLELLTDETQRGMFLLTMDRDGAPVNVLLPAAPAGVDGEEEPPGVAGLVWKPPATGLPVETVAADSRAADAGIRAGDRLLRIDGVEITSADEVRDVLAPERDATAFVELQRGGRRLGILLR
ncbi:MAG: PDZ domain-containing protein [Acidobacteria bacterium]|nr:PDZ domain-containing protein [Acidobacteriota bacterium]